MSGYQSDIDLKDVNLVGDIPVENTTGGFGETEGNANAYTMNLDPPLTTYRVGLPLQVKFNVANTDVSTLNVNGLGDVPIKKITNSALVDLDAGDLDVSPIYDLKYDGVNFQVVTGVTPQIEAPSGTWQDKGTLNAPDFPNFPAGKVGDAYTVTGTGFIGDDDEGGGVPVNPGDVVYCLEDNDGGGGSEVGDQWNILRSSLASRNGLMNYKGFLNGATFPEFPAGIQGDFYTISGDGFIGDSDGGAGLEVKEKDVLYCTVNNDGGFFADPSVRNSWNIIQSDVQLATEEIAGIARFATEEELENDEVEEDLIVTSLGIMAMLSKFRSLFRTLGTVSAPANPTVDEEQLPGQYFLRAGTIERQVGLKITIIGSFRHSLPLLANPVDKTFRVYVGDSLVLSNQSVSNPEGEFKAEVLLYNVNDIVQKGYSLLKMNGQPDEFEYLQTEDNNWATENLFVRMTVQTPEVGQSQLINRFTWSIDRVH